MKKSLHTILFLILSFALHAQQWEVVLPDSIHIMDGFIDDDNTSYYVGFSTNGISLANGVLAKVYDNGLYELKSFVEHDNKHLTFVSIIALTNGNFLVLGRKSDEGIYDPGELVLMIINDNLDVVNEQVFQAANGFQGFYGNTRALIDDDGTVVLFAIARRQNPSIPETLQYIGVLFRFTQDSECLNCRYLIADYPDPLNTIYQITDLQLINDPYYNHTIALCPGKFGVESILHFDYDFNLLSDHLLEDPTPQWAMARRVDYAQSDYWYNENEMLIVCEQMDTIQVNHNHPHILIGRMNREGQISKQIQINKQDTIMYPCQSREGIAYANDSTIYILARCNTVDWYEPFHPQIYLINNELELLGCISFWDDIDYWPIIILPTSDDGCICVTEPYSLFYDVTPSKLCRFSREDFQPIWSINEKPEQEILSSVYPNPTTNEIHFDLTNIPTNSNVRLRISNMTGQTFIDRIIRGTGNLLTVGVKTLPSGVYTYRIYDKEKILFSGKFIKV